MANPKLNNDFIGDLGFYKTSLASVLEYDTLTSVEFARAMDIGLWPIKADILPRVSFPSSGRLFFLDLLSWIGIKEM